MSFSQTQVDALSAKLDPAHIANRAQAGRQLSYIEGWHAEAEANRIFGFHGWDSIITEARMVAENPRKIGQAGVDGWSVSYICRVRVTVTDPDGTQVIRDGVGAGHGIDRDLGLAHESAIKEAATDAEKRALKTFGNPFGLALYDKSRASVGAPEPAERDPDGPRSVPTEGPKRASREDPRESRTLRAEDEFPDVPVNTRGKSSNFARKDGDDALFKQISAEIATLESPAAVGAFIAGRKDAIALMPADWRAQLREELDAQRTFIREAETVG